MRRTRRTCSTTHSWATTLKTYAAPTCDLRARALPLGDWRMPNAQASMICAPFRSRSKFLINPACEVSTMTMTVSHMRSRGTKCALLSVQMVRRFSISCALQPGYLPRSAAGFVCLIEFTRECAASRSCFLDLCGVHEMLAPEVLAPDIVGRRPYKGKMSQTLAGQRIPPITGPDVSSTNGFN